jgi:ribosomal protein L40E
LSAWQTALFKNHASTPYDLGAGSPERIFPIMTSCKKCGALLPEDATICPDCGTKCPTPQKAASDQSHDSFFSVPYLSGAHPTLPESEEELLAATEETPKETKKKKSRRIPIDQIADPTERAFAKQNRRNKCIRIVALIVVLALILSGVLYFFLRDNGYKQTLKAYVNGRVGGSGTQYLSIVPETYLLQSETSYDMTRPEIRSTVKSYLSYVEEQMESDFGDNLKLSYKIVSETSMEDEDTLESVESTISSTYGVDVSVTEVAYVTIHLTTKGSETQQTETKSLTFFETDGRWCSLDAMQIVTFACENAGYGLW